MKYLATAALVLFATSSPLSSEAGSVKPGDSITPDNASAVADLVSPGNYELVMGIAGLHDCTLSCRTLRWSGMLRHRNGRHLTLVTRHTCHSFFLACAGSLRQKGQAV